MAVFFFPPPIHTPRKERERGCKSGQGVFFSKHGARKKVRFYAHHPSLFVVFCLCRPAVSVFFSFFSVPQKCGSRRLDRVGLWFDRDGRENLSQTPKRRGSHSRPFTLAPFADQDTLQNGKKKRKRGLRRGAGFFGTGFYFGSMKKNHERKTMPTMEKKKSVRFRHAPV